ncbi:hypothetical protein [Streptomyces sp. NPDC005486]|uniref:hypothetical protein n=1 Tax=Streptomyces sp. NPDC005486 TaxID=3155345 RepID=UPI0033BF3E47
MVTEQDLHAAEVEVAAAEEALDAAEEHHSVVGSEAAGADVKYARGRAYNARDVLRRLRTAWAAEQQSRAVREAAQEAFEAEGPVMVARLVRARDEAADAVVEAQRAVGRLLDVVGAYDAAVVGAARELRARGLRVDAGGERVGGTSAGGVRLDEETFMPVGAMDLLAAVMAAAVGARDQRHPLAGLKWQNSGTVAAAAARVALLRYAAAAR